MGRKSIERSSNLVIYYENCFKDLCLRPSSENVLSHSSLPRGNVPGRRKEQHLIFQATLAPIFSFTTLFYLSYDCQIGLSATFCTWPTFSWSFLPHWKCSFCFYCYSSSSLSLTPRSNTITFFSVLICISQMTNDIEHLFMFVMSICVFLKLSHRLLCSFLTFPLRLQVSSG